MGVIIISGIVASTILTLWLTPALEFLFKGKQK
jgi:multidrug efflux pump subunit AcrB